MDIALSLRTLQRGGSDPCQRSFPDGTLWRTTRMTSGTATVKLSQTDLHNLRCDAWGDGAEEAVAQAPDLLGCTRDTVDDFEPTFPEVAEAHRRTPGLRIPRTGRVFEALAPSILEQRVLTREAQRSWHRAIAQWGDDAPGPAAGILKVPLSAEQVCRQPAWQWHRLGVDDKRTQALLRAARAAERLDECAELDKLEAAGRILSLAGIGPWTLAETAQRALGDADALSVGDLYLAPAVGMALTGRRTDDAGMVELLEPWRPHRYRFVRLLFLSRRLRG